MAVGWANDGAVQEQIDATIEAEVARARSRMNHGLSLTHCEDCGEEIPEARRLAILGVRRCIACQQEADLQGRRQELFNRRGSKDSQIR